LQCAPQFEETGFVAGPSPVQCVIERVGVRRLVGLVPGETRPTGAF
jgi:hypothetical protein